MLVLTRKLNERITIGDVTIKVVNVGTKNVRLGVDAPSDVPVMRTEILERLAAPNAQRLEPNALSAA